MVTILDFQTLSQVLFMRLLPSTPNLKIQVDSRLCTDLWRHLFPLISPLVQYSSNNSLLQTLQVLVQSVELRLLDIADIGHHVGHVAL